MYPSEPSANDALGDAVGVAAAIGVALQWCWPELTGAGPTRSGTETAEASEATDTDVWRHGGRTWAHPDGLRWS